MDVEQTTPPLNEEKYPKKKWYIIGIIALIIILLLGFFFRQRKNDNLVNNRDLLTLLKDVRTDLEWPGITLSSASTNLSSIDEAYRFVKDDTYYLPYTGAFLNPEMVLKTRVANMHDRAALLNQLLVDLGYETRIGFSETLPEHLPNPGVSQPFESENLDALAHFIGYNQRDANKDHKQQAETYQLALNEIKEEVEDATTVLENILGSDLFDGEAPVSYLRDSEWYWIEAKQEDGDWRVLDPNYPDHPRPDSPNYVSLKQTEQSIIVTATYTDKSEKVLLTYTGDITGNEADLMFMPADRSPAAFSELKNPNDVDSWLPILQVGKESTVGTAFSPIDGTLLSTLDGKPNASIDEEGNLLIKSVPVQSLQVERIDASTFPRIQVRLRAETKEKPYWHARHFSITDQGQDMNVRIVSTASELQPVSAILDTSSSMSKTIDLAKQAMSQLVERLPQEQPFTLDYYYAGSVYNLINIESFPDDRQAELDAVNSLNISGNTPLLTSIEKALTQIEGPSYIVLLSDGYDSAKNASGYQERLDNLMQRVRDSEKTFITIGIGSVDISLLQGLASESKGAFFSVQDAEGLPAVYDEITSIVSGQIVIEYDYPYEKREATEEIALEEVLHSLEIALEGFDGKVSGKYSQIEPFLPPARLESIDVKMVAGQAGSPLINMNRKIANFGENDHGWQLMQRASLWMTPGMMAPNALSARRFDQWITLMHLQQLAETGETDTEDLNRGMSFLQAWTTNAFAYMRLSLKPENAQWHPSPTYYVVTDQLLPRDNKLIARKRLHLVGSTDADYAPTFRDNLPLSLSLASIEANLMGVESVNASLIKNQEDLVLYNTPESLPEGFTPHRLPGPDFSTIASPKDTRYYWNHLRTYGSTYGNETLDSITTKGASAEQIAAEFDDIHDALSAATGGGYAALAGMGIPSGAVLSMIASHFDNVVSLYCYATVMMNYVSESIGGEDFDPVLAQAEAAKLCGINGSDGNSIQKKFARDYASSFVQGTYEGAVGIWPSNWSRGWTGGNAYAQGAADAAISIGIGWASSASNVNVDSAVGFGNSVYSAITGN